MNTVKKKKIMFRYKNKLTHFKNNFRVENRIQRVSAVVIKYTVNGLKQKLDYVNEFHHFFFI